LPQDNSDAQYSSFRDNIPYLLILLPVHPFLRRVYEYYTCSTSPTNNGISVAAGGDARLANRISFDFYFALIFITALHGASATKVLAILFANYNIAKALPRKYIPAATWVFNIATLFANELCGGYPLARVAAFWTSAADDSALLQWARNIDSFGGLMPRWEILFNITTLRLISFNMDYYWSLDYPSASPIEVSLHPYEYRILLMAIRRNNSIQQRFRNVTESRSPPIGPLSTAETTSHTLSTHLYTSLAPS
jgi:hypothetical protein